MDKFEFVELETPASNSKRVAFKNKPNFEKPGDRNRDNIYEVEVVASDTSNTVSRAVTVKVTDEDEEGKVELSTQDAVVGTEIEATLVDSDGDVDLRERVEPADVAVADSARARVGRTRPAPTFLLPVQIPG